MINNLSAAGLLTLSAMKPNGIGMAAILLLYTSLFQIRQQSNHNIILSASSGRSIW